MPIRFDTRNQRWRFEFDQVIAGQRQRASRLLPKGYTKAEAQKFELEETKRLHSVAAGVSRPEPLIEDAVLLYLKHHAPALKSFANTVRELKACYDAYAGKPFSALPAIALSYKPVDANKNHWLRQHCETACHTCERPAATHGGIMIWVTAILRSGLACRRCATSVTCILVALNFLLSAKKLNPARLGQQFGLPSTAACEQPR